MLTEVDIESIDKYYQLKNKYEEDYERIKKKILSIKGLSWKERRKNLLKKKAKCVNCKRPVGSIFSSIHADLSRKIYVKCGDTKSPCNLDIEIELGSTSVLKEEMTKYKKDIQSYHTEIILYNYNMIFGYLDKNTAIEKIDDVKERHNNTNLLLEDFINKIIKIEEDPDTIKKMEDELVSIYDSINDIKLMIVNFDTTNNIQYVQDAVSQYTTILLPKIEGLRNTKYVVMKIEENEKDGTFHLIQKKNVIEQYEVNDGDKIGVTKFVFGIQNKTKKNRTMRVRGTKSTNNRRTRRNVGTISVVDGEEEEEEEEDSRRND